MKKRGEPNPHIQLNYYSGLQDMLLVLAVAMDTYSFSDCFINSGRCAQTYPASSFWTVCVSVTYSAWGHLSQISIDEQSQHSSVRARIGLQT